MSFYVSTATFFLLHCDEWDRVVALPRHKFVTGATLLQLSEDVLKEAFKQSLDRYSHCWFWHIDVCKMSAGADSGGGGAHLASAPPPKIGKKKKNGVNS